MCKNYKNCRRQLYTSTRKLRKKKLNILCKQKKNLYKTQNNNQSENIQSKKMTAFMAGQDQRKLDKSKGSPYSLVVFKHGFSLET